MKRTFFAILAAIILVSAIPTSASATSVTHDATWARAFALALVEDVSGGIIAKTRTIAEFVALNTRYSETASTDRSSVTLLRDAAFHYAGEGQKPTVSAKESARLLQHMLREVGVSAQTQFGRYDGRDHVWVVANHGGHHRYYDPAMASRGDLDKHLEISLANYRTLYIERDTAPAGPKPTPSPPAETPGTQTIRKVRLRPITLEPDAFVILTPLSMPGKGEADVTQATYRGRILLPAVTVASMLDLEVTWLADKNAILFSPGPPVKRLVGRTIDQDTQVFIAQDPWIERDGVWRQIGTDIVIIDGAAFVSPEDIGEAFGNPISFS